MVGGPLVSTVFGIILVAGAARAMYSMVLSLRIRLVQALGREDQVAPAPVPAPALGAGSSRPTLETAARSAEPVSVASDD